jgi:hypothetical protein
VADFSHEMTILSLNEINHALRQQAVDLVLSIAALKERAAFQSTTKRHEIRTEGPIETAFGSVSRSLRSAGPAKSNARTLYRPKRSGPRS